MSDASTLFEVLASDHRRRILLLLCQTDSLQVPKDLRPRGQNTTQQPSQLHPTADIQDSHTLTIELVHNHLPKLQAAGFIKWDRETQTVSQGPQFSQIEPTLSVLCENAAKFPADLL